VPGTVNFADWSVSWSIPLLQGGGMTISQAYFKGSKVLHMGTQPFVLVPYHGNSPTFKDGLNSGACGSGIAFTAMKPTAPNAPEVNMPPGSQATNDNQYDPIGNPGGAVMVEKEPATLTEPAKAVIWAKLQAYNYQYIQQWEFNADGSVHVKVGLGARLWTYDALTGGHIHNFYFRLDFDIVSSGNNLVQRFGHAGNNPGDDKWTDIKVESKETMNPAQFTKWRILNKTPKPNGQFRSYELTPGSDGAPDGTYSTGDLWVVRYKYPIEDGSTVACKDTVLGSTYCNGESVDGEDVVVWYCLRHHHQPRQLAEETNVVPYEFLEFHLEPRDFLDETPKNLYPTTPSSPF